MSAQTQETLASIPRRLGCSGALANPAARFANQSPINRIKRAPIQSRIQNPESKIARWMSLDQI
jgi:hypothetical protein